MSEQEVVTKTRKKKWSYNATKIMLNPSISNELHGYYDDYALQCQQAHHIPVKFQIWVIEMAKEGYIAWKDKVRKKYP